MELWQSNIMSPDAMYNAINVQNTFNVCNVLHKCETVCETVLYEADSELLVTHSTNW